MIIWLSSNIGSSTPKTIKHTTKPITRIIIGSSILIYLLTRIWKSCS
ncbi:hypothetical protein MCHI_003294 [Candidatus Magnetoovum chiemensis]|nr:hypothetical protein MCHI_003294 [Candidatus Magnetoovum chiemensis]